MTRGRGHAVSILFGPVVSKTFLGFQNVFFGIHVSVSDDATGICLVGLDVRVLPNMGGLVRRKPSTNEILADVISYLLSPFILRRRNVFYGLFFSSHTCRLVFTPLHPSFYL